MSARNTPAFWVGFVMVVGLMGTALISPLYSIYKIQWSLQATDISLIYVIYMLGALFSLLVLGKLPDKVGYWSMLMASIVLTIVGTVITVFAAEMVTLCIGRFIVGTAASVASTAGSVALNNLAPIERRSSTSLMVSLIIAAGFGVGPLIGGVMAQALPMPLLLPYMPTLVLAVLALVVMFVLIPRDGHKDGAAQLSAADFLPKMTGPGKGKTLAFAFACGSPFLAFGMFGIYASMLPLMLDEMLHISGPLVSGGSVALILIVSSVWQVIIRHMPPRQVQLAGFGLLVLSNVAMLINLSVQSPVVFGIGVVLTALGHGMSMLGSMAVLNAMAGPSNRGGLTSSYMVVGYCGAIIPTMGVGFMADSWGMNPAMSVFCMAMIVLAVVFAAANWSSAKSAR